MRTLILGLSTRALAESAADRDQEVFTLDYFGDRDQKSLVKNHSLARDFGLPFSAENLLRASNNLIFDSVVYTSNLENHPEIVKALASRADILGNGPDVLGSVRDWACLREFCTQESIPHPRTLLPGEEISATSHNHWLVKSMNSGGGSHIRPWDGRPLKSPLILQACVCGRPASAAFVADGEKAVVIGLTQQLIGRPELGAFGYSWCGNILPLFMEQHERLVILEEVERIVAGLVRHFRLIGLGGIDFVVAPGPDGRPCPYLVEINPRYTASMELIEMAYGINMYSLHVAAMRGELPVFSLSQNIEGPYWGKGIVFAYRSLLIKNSDEWADSGRRDIPFEGDEIKSGRPICTALALGETHHHCLANLLENAAAIRRETGDLGEWEWNTNLH